MDPTTLPEVNSADPRYKGNRQLILVMYALYIASVFIGFTWVVALIMHYIKRSDITDPILSSHLAWQIRTFWFAVLGSLIGIVLAMILVGYVVLVVVGLWYLYRLIRGVLALLDNKGMPVKSS